MSVFCIYTNKFTNDPSPEHIIPLSLGGHNDFVIDVDRKFNNDIGSKVDGKLANDFLVLFERNKAVAKGHSGKYPKPVVKSATLEDGTPVQAIFGSDGLNIFDLKSKSFLPISDKRGRTIECKNIIVDVDIDLMFVAKAALSAGYFAYGHDFKNHIETGEFRKIMNFDKSNLLTDSKARVYKRFHDPEPHDDMYHILKMATELGGCSSVVMVPSNESFGVAIGILGKFLGFISVPCRSEYLPNHAEYKYGHCIYLQNDQVKRFSFDYIRMNLLKVIGDNNSIQSVG